MKILLVGLAAWLIVEALFSLYLGVFFNVGVDVGVLALFSFPLIKAIRCIADAGYRGHNALPEHKFKVYTSGQKRRVTPQIKREFKRRAGH
jgi:hypothetical protein